MRAMMGTATTMLLVIGPMGLGAGCLSEQGRRVLDGEDGDASDTTSDSTSDTRVDAPDTDLCANANCDDGDPCTFDQCDPATGQCSSIGVPGDVPARGCFNDADCDDGDPCTVNTCVGLGCGAGSFCSIDIVPGCNDCTTGCSDGDPCTRDSCRDGQCLHDFHDGCLAGCVAGTTYSIADIRTSPGLTVDPLKTSGELYFHDTMRSCNDGPTCDCSGYPGLRDGGFDLVVTDSANSGASEWQCKSMGCDQPIPTCQPALVQVPYRVWGHPLYNNQLFQSGDAAAPARLITGLSVVDFCLETEGTSLVGQYNGVVQVGGYSLTFLARISVGGDGRLRLRYGRGECESCPNALLLNELEAPLTVGDGWVEFDAPLPTLAGQVAQTVRLYSNRNTLRGAYGNRDGVVPFIALPPGGTFELTRL